MPVSRTPLDRSNIHVHVKSHATKFDTNTPEKKDDLIAIARAHGLRVISSLNAGNAGVQGSSQIYSGLSCRSRSRRITTMDLFSLAGRTALVTGATRGIGQSMALALAEAGANIVLVQRDTSNTTTKQQIEQVGRRATIFVADLASQESVSALVGKVIQDGHDIDILLNCAGIQRRHPSHLFPLQDWDEVRHASQSITWHSLMFFSVGSPSQLDHCVHTLP